MTTLNPTNSVPEVLDPNAVIDLLKTKPEWTGALWEGEVGACYDTQKIIAAIQNYPHAIEMHPEGSHHGDQGTWLWVRPIKFSVQIDPIALALSKVRLTDIKDTKGRKFKIGDPVKYTNDYGVEFFGHIVGHDEPDMNDVPRYFTTPDGGCYWLGKREFTLTLID